jgi:hypothetical protein
MRHRDLRDQLEVANRRIDKLLISLADARTAAINSASEAAALHAQPELLAARRRWPR